MTKFTGSPRVLRQRARGGRSAKPAPGFAIRLLMRHPAGSGAELWRTSAASRR
ncbi:hypothetical protein PJI17_11465 [Mycobacterium kansasii]|nr:hypothetical protein I547_0275 [Mycobacterium kansasii 824]